MAIMIGTGTAPVGAVDIGGECSVATWAATVPDGTDGIVSGTEGMAITGSLAAFHDIWHVTSCAFISESEPCGIICTGDLSRGVTPIPLPTAAGFLFASGTWSGHNDPDSNYCAGSGSINVTFTSTCPDLGNEDTVSHPNCFIGGLCDCGGVLTRDFNNVWFLDRIPPPPPNCDDCQTCDDCHNNPDCAEKGCDCGCIDWVGWVVGIQKADLSDIRRIVIPQQQFDNSSVQVPNPMPVGSG